MEGRRKRAYRNLLYHAMLDIRPLAWLGFNRFLLVSPRTLLEVARRIRHAGELADALHNLAHFSAHGFEGFDEDWFWGEIQSLAGRYAEFGVAHYRQMFDQSLEDARAARSGGRWSLPDRSAPR